MWHSPFSKIRSTYILKLNSDFRPFLLDGVVWGKKVKNKPTRDLQDETKVETIVVEGEERQVQTIVKSKEEKVLDVDFMLEQVANYAPNIPRHDITRESGSLPEVFMKIRQYYNIQQSGALLNDIWNVKREFEESPQALYSRMKQLYNVLLLFCTEITKYSDTWNLI